MAIDIVARGIAVSSRKTALSNIWVPIGFHDRGVAGSGGVYDTTNNSLTSQTLHYTHASYPAKSVRLALAGFDICQNGEVDRNNTITGYASIIVDRTSFSVPTSLSALSGATVLNFAPTTTNSSISISVGDLVTGTNIASNCYVTNVAPVYDASGANITTFNVTITPATTGAISSGQNITFQGHVYPVKFGGKRQFTLEPMHDYLISDPIGVEIPANSTFKVRLSLSFSSTGFLLSDFPTASSGSTRSNPPESCQRGASLGDQTLSPIQPTNSGGGFWQPMILAQMPLTNGLPCVGVIGDSIAAGTGDSADVKYRIGFVQKTFSNTIPYINLSRGGMTAINNAYSPYEGMYAAINIASCTDILLQLCRNDIWNGLTAVQTRSNIQQIAAPHIAVGRRVWVFTCPPYTTSTDSWATITNQTIANTTREAERISYNADIRANYASYGFAGVCDVSAIWEDGSNAGKWRVDLGQPTTDGIHPSAVLHALAVSSGVIPVSRFTP